MRSIIACGSAVLAAVVAVACATSDSIESTQTPDAGEHETNVPEAGANDVASDAPAPSRLRCSPAGWCETSLPDEDLQMSDIWPLAGRAFAIAQSATVGIKILEWNDADSSWSYIDDGTQNEPGFGAFPGRIWAPDENEVYFTIAPGYVYHGVRPTPPAATWSWTRHELEENDPGGTSGTPLSALSASLGVWGTGPGDVHAWFKNTIFALNRSAGGSEEWIPEYIADDVDDPTEHIFFVTAAGTGPRDVWFSGARMRDSGRCTMLVRKSASSFETIADGTLQTGATCTPRDGTLMIGGTDGWLTDLQAVGAGQLVGLKGWLDVVRLSATGSGYGVDIATIPRSSLGLKESDYFASLWYGPDAAWLAGNGLVVRGTDVWNGGKYEFSTLAINGAPNVRALHQIRGTSNTNLWTIGERNALHKTTP